MYAVFFIIGFLAGGLVGIVVMSLVQVTRQREKTDMRKRGKQRKTK